MSLKIETAVWLDVMSTTPRSLEYPRAIGTPAAVRASDIAPLLSNESNKALGLFGFQFETPLMADLEVNAAYAEPLAPIATYVAPVEANLYVHVGDRFVANFVTALSNF